MTLTPDPTTATTWDYAPAPESTDLLRLRDTHELFIGGAWTPPRSGEHRPSLNPATEEPLSSVAWAGPEDVDRAVAAARAALPDWQALAPRERGKVVFLLARLVQERARELAVLETLDGGKPIREARDVDVPLAAPHIFYKAGGAEKHE
jgi:aldehyde dehydrogenase (NAD+)